MNDMKMREYGLLAVCAIRYCLGRRTYMPSTVCGIISRNLSQISNNDLNVMLRDIEEYGDTYKTYGDSCDDITWMNMKTFLQTEINERERLEVFISELADRHKEEYQE